MNAANVTLKTPAFWIEDLEVKDGVLGDLDKYIERVTRPEGVLPKDYIKQLPDGSWALVTWWPSGEEILIEFETEAEAEKELESLHVHDILNNDETVIFLSRKSAEDHLNAVLEIIEAEEE
jgi:hypothetical protein